MSGAARFGRRLWNAAGLYTSYQPAAITTTLILIFDVLEHNDDNFGAQSRINHELRTRMPFGDYGVYSLLRQRRAEVHARAAS